MSPRRLLFWPAITAFSLALPLGISAQELSILDANSTQLIAEEVSGDAAYSHIRFMTQFHRPRGGADGLWRVAEYFRQKAEDYGLANVQLIKQASTTQPWNARFADLWIIGPAPERIASTIQSPLHLADYSRRADVTAELVDIGAGQDSDYEGTDVAGKIVLTYGPLGSIMQSAVLERGALGVIWYPSPFAGETGTNGAGIARPDQLRWIRLPSQGSDAGEPTFAFGLSLRQGVHLRNKLAESETPIRVRAVVDAEFDSEQGDEPWQVMVEAFIPGTDPELDQDVILTGHLQEEGTSANDDASGTASTLEVARALNRLISEGRLPRPRRNLRFWWVTEISSQRQYFADHPDAHRRMWVNVNQDMVGANQAQDVMRKQNVNQLPAARFHFFNDVVASVVDYMVTTNTAELAQLQNGIPLYPKPHLSHLGTNHRYNAQMIFFHTSTDHMTFLEAPIGIPGTTFTNMPDRFIHSSDDDLWNIDPTQLGRNAAAVAMIAYIMASADSTAVPTLAAATVGRGMERLGRNLRLALAWIAGDADKSKAHTTAVNQIRYAVERETIAIQSLAEIGSGTESFLGSLRTELDRWQSEALRQVDLMYREVSGERRVPRANLGETERRLAELRPGLVAGPQEFLEGRREIRGVRGLHGLMAFEILNAVDGERTGLDIYRYVAAEAREAGAHYYGTVTADAVLGYLQNVEKAGLIRLSNGGG